VARLAGKRGFYAGAVLGAAGLLGAGAAAFYRRRRGKGRALTGRKAALGGPPPGTTPRPKPAPGLPVRTRLEPVRPSALAGQRCAGCRSAADSKPGAWYRIGERAYCQDCAPAAARAADVDLVTPAGARRGSERLPTWQEAAGLVGPEKVSKTLPVGKRVNIRLSPSRVRVFGGYDQGRPVYIETRQGFVALRPDYHSPDGFRDTGLAIVPDLTPDRWGTGIREDTSRWHVIHIQSGQPIPEAVYGALDQAEMLAGLLAQVDFSREAAQFSEQEGQMIGNTVKQYNRALRAEAQVRQPGSNRTGGATVAKIQDTAAAQALVGNLVADKFGGISRVLAEEGDRLFLVDSIGARYEVYRDEVRPPEARDFELVRVAQPLAPTGEQPLTCSQCGRDAEKKRGESWWRMNRRIFCPACGEAYAAAESYLKPDEITDELPGLGR